MKSNSKKYLIIILYWLVINLLIFLTSESAMPLSERILSSLFFSFGAILITLSFSKILFKNTIQNRKALLFIAKFLLMSVCLAVVYALIYKLFSYFELSGVFNSTTMLDENLSFISSITDDLPGIILLNLLFCGILLYYEYSQLQKTNLEYQLKILHSQINPHFMFNVLNYIYMLMQKDVDLASELLLKYSDTLHYQLNSGKKELVNVDQEIQFLKNYVDVEKFRWEDKLEVTCSWTIQDGGTKIPPLLLITFIENGFKHVSRSEHQKGFINIVFEQKGNVISLEVLNSKSNSSFGKKIKQSHIGLANAKAQLDILFAKRYTLTVKETDTTYSSLLVINL